MAAIVTMVALAGMVAVKGDAVDLEKLVEEGEIEVAHHDDTTITTVARDIADSVKFTLKEL